MPKLIYAPHNILLLMKEQIVYTGYFMESAQSMVFTRKMLTCQKSYLMYLALRILETKYGIWEGHEKVQGAGF